jgi:hypothetical protein
MVNHESMTEVYGSMVTNQLDTSNATL